MHPDEAILQHAKWNIENTYLLVGISEDIPTFLHTLEILVPHLFCNATQIYNQVGMFRAVLITFLYNIVRSNCIDIESLKSPSIF